MPRCDVFRACHVSRCADTFSGRAFPCLARIASCPVVCCRKHEVLAILGVWSTVNGNVALVAL